MDCISNISKTIAIFTLFFSSLGTAQTVQKILKDEEQIRQEMIRISRELGVTCTTCHDVKNFKSETLKAYKIGKEHMKITQLLKDKGFNGKSGPEATCYMCHRGKLKPDFQEPETEKQF